MKKLILILFLIPVLAIGQSKLHSQFVREAKKADSLFWNKFEIDAKKAAVDAVMETDSILYEQKKKLAIDHVLKIEGKDSIYCSRLFYGCIYETLYSNKTKNVLISEDDYLNEFMNAYMLGQLSFYYNKKFDYELLESKLKKIKIELRKIKNTEK